MLRPQEIPTYLEQGLFDLGITGRDWITETAADVVSLGELKYSKATSNPVRVIIAVPNDAPWQTVAELPEGVRISTEFPALTERFLAQHGVKARVVPSYGATEAKVPDIVDVIVDLTETGSSLRKNGLRILDTLLVSYTELVANRDAYEDANKRAAMYGALRAWLSTGMLPPIPELRTAMLAIKYTFTKKDEIQLISKEDLLDENPDLDLDTLDALCLTFAGPLHRNPNAGGDHPHPNANTAEHEYNPYSEERMNA